MPNSRLRHLRDYLSPHRNVLWLGMGALLAANGLGVYIPLLIRDDIDNLRNAYNMHSFTWAIILILILASVMWAVRMASRLLIFGIGRQVEYNLKQNIFQHLLLLEPSYFSTHTSGDLINRATSDVDSVRRLVGFSVLSLANTLFAYTLTFPAMLAIHVPLSLAAIAVYPLMLLVVQLFSRRLGEQQRRVQEQLSDLSELIQEDMSGMALIKIYGQEANERAAFAQKNQQLLKANLVLTQTRNFLFPLIQGLASISFLIVLAVGARAIASNAITIGDFVAFLILVERLVFPTALLGFTLTAYQRGQVSIDRVEAIFATQPQIKDSPQAIALDLEAIQGNLVARSLSYTYPDAQVPALDQLDFTIRAGETVAIVGPIGSGKSTLANALPRLLDIESGQLFVDGCDITELHLADLRRAIAYVPQESFLFSMTIADNIRYGDALSNLSQVEYAAKQAQIHPEILNFPQQYETLVGERGIMLSGGQRQRTSLARALLVDAPILILDDALSSVDNQTASQILHNLSTEQGKTVIFISHQLSAAAQADRILVMDRGRIVQEGSHDVLVTQSGLYQSLWEKHQLTATLQ
jgi:ATP-binding cassette subfamily B multidrug efflux pump